MRHVFVLTASALLVTFSAPSAHAYEYASAGCGLGSVFIRDEGFVQVFAATTNGISLNQTFGITSGTSRCGKSEHDVASAKVFIESNREALAKDISRGRGATIAGLSALARCNNPKAVGATLQRNFKHIFPRARLKDSEVSRSVLHTLKTHPELSCQAAG